MKCNATRQVDVVANDYDPNGFTPIAVTAATGAVVLSPTTVEITTDSGTGTYYLGYTLTNTAGGTASGTITVNVTGSYTFCNGQ